jgi:DNA-binding XRE family transcriptional regulator
MTPAATPMGPALPGSRLDRLHEAQDILKRLRAAGMTQAQIGEAIGINRTSVWEWAHGRKAPSADQLKRLRRLLPPPAGA